MIQLPLLGSLDVEGYGMFPGSKSTPGLHVNFKPGLTLVLGANGLGKTTLITLIYRMCTGPYEIAGISGSTALGRRKLEVTRLPPRDKRVLAARVFDEAVKARATLCLIFGNDRVTITRNLHALTLTQLSCNHTDLQATEDRFQKLIVDLSGLPSFGDWILVLRYLVFYFEERRELVWDPSAQRQILRLLLLPGSNAAAWAAKERKVLELDSRVRNLQNTLNREEREEQRAKVKVKNKKDAIEEILKLEESLAARGRSRLLLAGHA